tara:strand:- start:1641 stop:2681 length:1041 start_codon:yes stop_codon:yes gene_type:complete
MVRKAEVILDYQNYIDRPPIASDQLLSTACSNDSITIKSWFDIWVANAKANHEYLGSFKDNSVGLLFGKNKYGVSICAGSGPSLGYNADVLKNRKDVPLVSCLHNFHFFEDKGIAPDYYVSLDAGEVVLEEVSEGGKKTPEEYWALTKDRNLIAYIGSNPELLKKWQGKVYVYNAPVPDKRYLDAIKDIEQFSLYLGNGGNVLGACLYFSKAILGVHRVAMVGADFSFGYDHKHFHPWDSKYDDKLGNFIPQTDVFGIKVPTWPSYRNFKFWFEHISLKIPDPKGRFSSNWLVNCSEGGCLGSYPEGNLRSITQLALSDFLSELNMCEDIRQCVEDPSKDERRLLF